MQAFQITGPQQTELREVEQPEAGPGEVLVKVGAAGACHSDLHVMHQPAEEFAFPTPMTLGHENAGWVEASGVGVEGFEPGEPVAIYGIMGCGYCRACRRGADNACRNVPPGGIGLGRDGGMAPYVAVPVEQLIRIGDLDVTQAAPLTDAGLTPYHAISLSRDLLVAGAPVVVIGIGGLGQMAVQILAATTAAEVIAVDLEEDRLQAATDMGANHTVRSDENAADEIREIVGHSGAEVVLDFVGADPTIEIGRQVVATGGQLTIVGLGGGSLEVSTGVATTVPLETRVVVPFWGSRYELVEVIELARSGAIRANVETFPLGEAPTAYERLEAGEIQGRAVVIPESV